VKNDKILLIVEVERDVVDLGGRHLAFLHAFELKR
jgi:hypothetical protein